MEPLPGPYEILELDDGGVLTTKISDWSIGQVEIHPAYKPEGKFIKALRIHVPEVDKTYFPFYWDVTSQTLLAQLQPYLEQPGYAQRTFTITKHGVAPRARFTLAVK
jgi:hypothetical protein